MRRSDCCAVLLALAYPALFTWLYVVALAGQPAGPKQGVYLAGKVLQFCFPLLWVLVVQRRRRLRAFGRETASVSLRGNWGGIGQAVGFGALVMAAMLVGYHLWLKPAGVLAAGGEEIRAKLSSFAVDSPAEYAMLGLFYSLGHSFLEEYYWRWFVFGQLRQLLPLWPAIAVSSLGFTAHHVLLLATFFGWLAWPTLAFSLAVAVGGAVWAWLYQRSGSLLGPWLSHLLVDAGIFLVAYDLTAWRC